MRDKSKVLNQLEQITSILCKSEPHHYPGVLNGNSGTILYLAYYYTYVDNNKSYLNKIDSLLKRLVYQLNTLPVDSSFGSGYSGIVWLFEHLIRFDMLEQGARTEISKLTKAIELSITADVEANNFDYWYGFMGKYAIVKNCLREPVSQALRDWVMREMRFTQAGQAYFKNEKNEIDFGLSHGLPSILLFLSSEKLVPADKLTDIIKLFIFLSDSSEGISISSVSIFPPSLYEPDVGRVIHKIDSRYAWCYGDLGVLYALTALKCAPDTSLDSLIRKLVLNSNQRTNENSFVNYFTKYECYDPGFCHGIAGIFYLQQKINMHLNNDMQLSTNEYWFNLLLTNTQKLLERIPAKGSLNDNFEDMLNISGGIPCIGLVLLSTIVIDTDWDFCFMLNH